MTTPEPSPVDPPLVRLGIRVGSDRAQEALEAEGRAAVEFVAP